MSQIDVLMTKAKFTRSDLTALSGVSRPTVIKFLEGGQINAAKAGAIKSVLRDVRDALLAGRLPITRMRGSDADRVARLQAALTPPEVVEEAPPEDDATTSGGPED